MKNEIVLFTDENINIEVQINPEQETVWLTQKQMEVLFDVKHATISEHITNILASGELDETSVGFSDKSSGGRKPKIYNLDMILSVGYRVNSKRGIAFRKWANNVLKGSSNIHVGKIRYEKYLILFCLCGVSDNCWPVWEWHLQI
ncbi:MAG: RhuM family protein [Bulleidia sp.]|nr:RhuM family protein [Bulleidia sp.]